MDKIKGVNLGNWLVLEKWMSPTLYSGTTAEDETYLCLQLSENEKRARLKVHRDTWITERDFAWLASRGFNAVRIPVPFFLFEDHGPYVACTEYLDMAFDWAEKFGMRILVDLHTVPGSHNGSDNAGICGIVQWCTKPEYRALTLDVLERIALRYGSRKGLYGIQVLNEPIMSDVNVFGNSTFDISAHYKPADPEAAKANKTNDRAFLEAFYREAYTRIRKYLPKDKPVVYHDAFKIDNFDVLFSDPMFENIVLDTHQYLMFIMMQPGFDGQLSTYLEKIHSVTAPLLAESQRKIPTIVGEWCSSARIASMETMSREEARAAVRSLTDAQLAAFENCDGYFYWNYRVDTPNEAMSGWDMMRLTADGGFPDKV